MSMTLMAWLGKVEAKVAHAEFRVLYRLCWHTNEETLLCCPSIEELARGSNMTERSVYRAIDSLEVGGYISVARERWPNGTQKVNRYTILANIQMAMPDGRRVRVRPAAEDAESRVTQMSPGEPSRVTPVSPAGCHPCHPYNKEDITRKIPLESNDSKGVKPIFDPEKVMFDSGVSLLSAAGIKSPQARSILGRWKREHGAAAVIAAIGQCQREGAISPIEYIQGCFRQKAKIGAEQDELLPWER